MVLTDQNNPNAGPAMNDDVIPTESQSEEIISGTNTSPRERVDDTISASTSTTADRENRKGLFNRECKKCAIRKQECEEYKTGWQRALADYKNLQKEIDERRGEWARYSEQQILEEFIPVYDHLKMATNSTNEDGPWLEGVRHVLRQFAEILKNHGVEEIKTVGELFDPVCHEAVGEATDNTLAVDVIVKEIAAGYRMSGRLIRAAKVIVNKLS